MHAYVHTIAKHTCTMLHAHHTSVHKECDKLLQFSMQQVILRIGLSPDISCAVPTALLSLAPRCTIEVTAFMHWFLLVVASSMGNEENSPPQARVVPLAPPIPSCDVFLAPSTIPRSAYMGEQNNKETKYCVYMVYYCSTFVF